MVCPTACSSECGIAQGFPDSFRFYGNVISKHRQIGNAVPPPLAAAIGRKLRAVLEAKAAATRGAAAGDDLLDL